MDLVIVQVVLGRLRRKPKLLLGNLYPPDLYRPDLYPPDLYRPDLYRPDLYRPYLYPPQERNLMDQQTMQLTAVEISQALDCLYHQTQPQGRLQMLEMEQWEELSHLLSHLMLERERYPLH